MKKIITSLCLGLLIIIITGCSSQSTFQKSQFKNAYISVDINPSIEIITGDDGLVKSVVGLNDDAKVLLVDLDFSGKTVEDTMNEILKALTAMGYIKDMATNEILITTDAPNKEKIDENLEQIVNDYQKESHENIKFIRGDVEVSEELKKEAELLNVSLGKLKLILTISKYDSTLTKEILKDKPIAELNHILLNIRKDLADLVTDKLEKGYQDLKQKLDNEEEKAESLALVNAILSSEDSLLDKFLSDKMPISEFRDLCNDLKNEIENLQVVIDPATQEKIDQIQEKMRVLEDEIQALKSESKNHSLTKDEKKKLKSKLDEKRELYDDLDDQMEDFEELYDYEELLDEIWDEFEEKLEELDVDFEAMEEHFEESIEKALENLEKEHELLLKEYKEDCKNKKEEIKNALKEEKDFLKSLKE